MNNKQRNNKENKKDKFCKNLFTEPGIQEIIIHAAKNGKLKIRPIYINGNYINNGSPVLVKNIIQKSGSLFPDFDEVFFNTNPNSRPAEYKDLTSKFAYHINGNKTQEYIDFIKNKGFIIVGHHDFIPKGLNINQIDIYELESLDIIKSIIIEKIDELLRIQFDIHDQLNYWLMFQARNYYCSENNAKETKRWSPTTVLSNRKLGKGDIIVLVRFSNVNRTTIKKKSDDEIFFTFDIIEVTSTQMDRYIYISKNLLPKSKSLFTHDNAEKFKRIFEFKRIFTLERNIKLKTIDVETLRFKFKTIILNPGACISITMKEYQYLIDILNDYLLWYNEKRIKESLGYMSPMEYRHSLGLVG